MIRFSHAHIVLVILLLFGCKTGSVNEDTLGNGSLRVSAKNNSASKTQPEVGTTNDLSDENSAAQTPDYAGSPRKQDETIKADIIFNIRTNARKHQISPYIYGINHPQWGPRPRGITLVRNGGNRHTAYNWENNASHAGVDYYNQNDDYLGNPNVPGENRVEFIKKAFSHGASAMVTIPILGYVASDGKTKGDVNQTPNYMSTRFYVSKARKGAPFSMTPDLSDKVVYQDEFVNFLEKLFPDARTGANNEIFYSLDNEPGLWATTHPRLRGAESGNQGKPVTYAELIKKTIEYAAAIKDNSPNAKIFGPVLYGFAAFENLQSAPDANGRDFIEFYLQQMQQAEKKEGRRLVDVLDVHWYPEVNVPKVGKNITSTTAFPELVAERIQAPRSLWDEDYMEKSWISQRYLNEPIALLPRLQKKIDKYYPGTKIAITEYYYGGGNDISGAIAQADVLGIFGRENVFAATLWKLAENNDFIWGAFEMFTSYDQKQGRFGDLSVEATCSDVVNYSIYAALDSGNPGRMTIVLINKAEKSVTASLDVVHDRLFQKADVYQITAKDSNPRKADSISIKKENAFEYTLPPRSISLFELTVQG
ncbi:MAG: endoglucanase A [Deltaproteobacteria bacterium]|nr:endoglucanase A [Deltaproteobacteria bacterium]